MDIKTLVSAGIIILFTQINKSDRFEGVEKTPNSSYLEMAQHSLKQNTHIVQQKYIQIITLEYEYRHFFPE